MKVKRITLAQWPAIRCEAGSAEAVKEMELLMEMIRAVRNIRAEVNVPMSKKVELMIKPSGAAEASILASNEEFVAVSAAHRPCRLMSSCAPG